MQRQMHYILHADYSKVEFSKKNRKSIFFAYISVVSEIVKKRLFKIK